ncbi:MAG: guanine deaminase [candidate division WOR-3 bacterium]|nr:guanine deaminase [candidate division WOR-3 bacterium]
MMRIFRARVINFLDANNFEDYPNGFLAIDNNGQIFNYGKWHKKIQYAYRNAKVLDYNKFIILPGFIDVHLHLPQLHLRGRYGDELLNWLNNYVIKSEIKVSTIKKIKKDIKSFYQEMLKNGTTTGLIFSSSSFTYTDWAFRIAYDCGIRAIIGKAMMDNKFSHLPVESTQKSLNESIKLFEKWNGIDKRLYYAFSPRFAPATTESLLRAIAKFCRDNNTYIHTHLAENLQELQLTRRLFPQYHSYTELYYQTGILGPKTIVAHAIHLKDSEYKLLSQTQTKVAHCPSSNFFLHSGRANTAKMEKYNITIGLGSDVGAGPSFSMFSVMRDAYYVRRISPHKAFYYATLGGAKVLSWDNRIGNFAQGKEGDFIVVNYPTDCNKKTKTEELLSQLIFCGDDRLIIETYVQGKRLYYQKF